ncbi:MAG: pyridoxal 5-phosphate (PLP)-binding barrel domain protein [Pseudomonadota bacterium]|jgi:PLP dependent protein
MHKIAHNLTQVLNRIQVAAVSCGRKAQDITLLAVSKTQNTSSITEAHAAGQRAFGENYVQEALDKIAELNAFAIAPALEWHFLGPIQSNKTQSIAQHFSWVHTVSRLNIAQRLNAARPETLPPLNVCIQVNVDGELSKSGVALSEVAALSTAILQLPRLKLRGLMTIPNPENPAPAFAAVAALQHQLNQTLGLELDTLSMGMSDDLEAAIEAGATLVRVGTAIFGPRH